MVHDSMYFTIKVSARRVTRVRVPDSVVLHSSVIKASGRSYRSEDRASSNSNLLERVLSCDL